MSIEEAIKLFSREANSIGLCDSLNYTTDILTMEITVPPSLRVFFDSARAETLGEAWRELASESIQKQEFPDEYGMTANARFLLADLYYRKVSVDWWLLMFGIWHRTWGQALNRFPEKVSRARNQNLRPVWQNSQISADHELPNRRILRTGVRGRGYRGKDVQLWFEFRTDQGEIDPQTEAMELSQEHWGSYDNDEHRRPSSAVLEISAALDWRLDVTPLVQASEEFANRLP